MPIEQEEESVGGGHNPRNPRGQEVQVLDEELPRHEIAIFPQHDARSSVASLDDVLGQVRALPHKYVGELSSVRDAGREHGDVIRGDVRGARGAIETLGETRFVFCGSLQLGVGLARQARQLVVLAEASHPI